MHYYRFSIGDYARSTRHLSNDEDLAYRRLLDMYYENEGPIPLETQWVARRIRMDSDTVQTLLDDMFQRTEEGYRHPRCDAEIAEYHKQAERNRLNGKRGGRPKTLRKQQNENPVGFQSEPSPNPVVTLTTNQEPLTTNQEPITPQSPPRGVGKPDDVSDDVWRDFKKHRAKHGGITDRVIAGFRREAEKAGWTLEQAMDESITQGWRGFKAEYVKGRSNEQRFSSNSNTYRLAMQKLGFDQDG